MIATIEGQLEIDTDRGVIYFHAREGPFAGTTVLRICSLPKPIPLDGLLDVTQTVSHFRLSNKQLKEAYHAN